MVIRICITLVHWEPKLVKVQATGTVLGFSCIRGAPPPPIPPPPEPASEQHTNTSLCMHPTRHTASVLFSLSPSHLSLSRSVCMFISLLLRSLPTFGLFEESLWRYSKPLHMWRVVLTRSRQPSRDRKAGSSRWCLRLSWLASQPAREREGDRCQ